MLKRFCILFAFLLLSLDAFSIPTGCLTGETRNAYEQGVRLQTRSLQFLWQQFGGCERVERFADAITLPSLNLNTRTIACRYSGTVDTTKEFVEDKMNFCRVQCLNDGILVGEANGQVFCQITSTLDRHPELADCLPSVTDPIFETLCNVAFQQSCLLSGGSYASNHCSSQESLHSDVLSILLNNACRVLPFGGLSMTSYSG